MFSRSTQIIFLAFLLNNAVWLSVWINRPGKSSESPHANLTASSPVKAEYHHALTGQVPDPAVELHAHKSVAKEKEDLMGLVDQPPILDPAEDDLSSLEEQQNNFEFDRETGMALFFATDSQKKLETLDVLGTHGDDLKFLQEVLKTDDDKEIKKAVLQKFHQQNTYEATNLLIETLDDSNLDVALTALHVIASNGDRSLIPILRKKMEPLPSGAARDFYTTSIQRMENTSAMDMEE